jgi:hypothetical protein
MRNLTDVIVDKVIVHALEPRSKHKLISEAIVPLKTNPDLTKYLVKHIELSLGDETARAARFADLGLDRPAGISQDILADGGSFVPGSQAMAEQLYDIMLNNRATADGDLAVCRFHSKQKPEDPYLALIKLDPVGVFRNVSAQDDLGREYLDLVLDPYVFPRDFHSLQKGAYIRCIDGGPEYHALLVDKQAKRGEIARFFRDAWLGAEFELDDAELTRQLYLVLIRTANQIRPKLQANQDRQLGLEIYDIFGQRNQGAIFNWGTWIGSLALPNSERDTLEESLDATFADHLITLDMTLVNLLTRRRAFDGEGGLHFGVDTPFARDVIQRVSYQYDPVKAAWIYEVVLHTDTWNEKP